MNTDELALCAAFPAGMRGQAEMLMTRQPYRSPLPVRRGESVVADGQSIRLVCRQYALFHAKGDEVLQLMAHCLNTRHHDGYVRERHFKRLLAAGQPAFAAPFAAQLLGEYVLPIQSDVAVFFHNNAAALARFFADNPAYWRKQQDRIRSYWHCYHRSRHPVWRDYPICGLVREIDAEIGLYRRL
ncbi:MAG: hypothetical protein Q3966_00825 [Neisseria sp.]|nr:hypothetical protein [Neisseria sp.]